jgi:hypothetical protein
MMLLNRIELNDADAQQFENTENALFGRLAFILICMMKYPYY